MTILKGIKSNVLGFTLIEILITIAIMGIVLGIASMNFTSWKVKYNIEAQTRGIQADLNEARTSALTQKKYYGIVFQPNSYVIKTYSSSTSAADPVASGTSVATKTLTYGLTKKGSPSIADTHVVFDTSGITYDLFTIFVNPYNADPAKEPASVNCIVVHTVRVNMGKINETTCEFK